MEGGSGGAIGGIAGSPPRCQIGFERRLSQTLAEKTLLISRETVSAPTGFMPLTLVNITLCDCRPLIGTIFTLRSRDITRAALKGNTAEPSPRKTRFSWAHPEAASVTTFIFTPRL